MLLDADGAHGVVQVGESVIIVDAGGGTVDVSSYHFVSTSPISVEEVTSPECESFLGDTRCHLR